MGDELKRAAACFARAAFGEAEHLCRAALEIVPGDAGAHVLLGRIFQAQGQGDAAQAEFRAAVTANPAHVDGWVHWAKLLKTHGHFQNAEACLRLGLTHAPHAFELHNDLAVLFLMRGAVSDAEHHLQRAMEIFPQSEIALCNLGIVRKHQGKTDEAIAAYRQAIAINPSIPEAHNNLGDALKQRDIKAAAAAFETALTLRPDYPEALDSLGVVHFFEGRLREALEKFDRALAVQPAFHRAMNHKTTTLFMLGRLEDAWKAYRHRFEAAGYKVAPHGRFPTPVWAGEPLAGKALLVWTELGLGEEVMQASMFHDTAAIAARLTVECSPRLMTLFTRSFPEIAFVPRINPSRASTVQVEADYQIAGGDLGAAVRTDFAAFPRHSGYLIPKADQVAALKQKYGKSRGAPIVGLSWASRKSVLDATKTLALSAFAPILRQSGVVFVNLQYGSQPDEIAEVASALGVDIITDETIDLSGDMDPVAAQIAAMDLVIAVSTTAVHLAGALNVPVWNIVPGYNASGMWHWFYDSEKSPWYPSMKIYRRVHEESRALMQRIAADLRDFRDRHAREEGAGCSIEPT